MYGTFFPRRGIHVYFCTVTRLNRSMRWLRTTPRMGPRLRGEDSVGEILASVHNPNPVIPAQAGNPSMCRHGANSSMSSGKTTIFRPVDFPLFLKAGGHRQSEVRMPHEKVICNLKRPLLPQSLKYPHPAGYPQNACRVYSVRC
ncbi:Uncharacterised protein [Legionella geestiana]|nr:Uncharacterised protein [Legionella geestiana]